MIDVNSLPFSPLILLNLDTLGLTLCSDFWMLLGELLRVGLTLGLNRGSGWSSNGRVLPPTHWSVLFFFTSLMLSLSRLLSSCNYYILFSSASYPTDFLCDSLMYYFPIIILSSSFTSASTLNISLFVFISLLAPSHMRPYVNYFKLLYFIGGSVILFSLSCYSSLMFASPDL